MGGRQSKRESATTTSVQARECGAHAQRRSPPTLTHAPVRSASCSSYEPLAAAGPPPLAMLPTSTKCGAVHLRRVPDPRLPPALPLFRPRPAHNCASRGRSGRAGVARWVARLRMASAKRQALGLLPAHEANSAATVAASTTTAANCHPAGRVSHALAGATSAAHGAVSLPSRISPMSPPDCARPRAVRRAPPPRPTPPALHATPSPAPVPPSQSPSHRRHSPAARRPRAWLQAPG